MSEAAPPRRSPTRAAWMVAGLGLLLALALGWAMLAIGAARLRKADEIRTAAETKNRVALTYATNQAMGQAQEARMAVTRSNWGQAQTSLSRINDVVTLMEQVAPEDRRRDVAEARKQLAEAQRLAGQHSAKTVDAVDALTVTLDKLRQ